MNYTDRIFPTNKGLTTYLDELMNKNYQIPTFQRSVVWEKENVKKLWDSIYKFYPLGSILIWKTDLKLQNHRQIGGHLITDPDFNRVEYQYILDGQQRTTSLLTSLYGGSIEDKPGFNPTVYVDLTIENESDIDDESYKSRFLFWDEIDDRNGELRANTGRRRRHDEGLIIKLNDIKLDFDRVQGMVVNHTEVAKSYSHPYWQELRKIKQVLDNYRISFIEVKGIQVTEVCQIFERINQAGKPLNIFDIVVAKTFRPKTQTDPGFYLRELIDNFRNTNQSDFLSLSDLDYLQILAVLIKLHVPNSNVYNITDRYLNEIKTDHITSIWEDAKRAILKTFDFFENHLNIKTPGLIPFRYLYFTITSYFFRNNAPDYTLLKQYFWYCSFHSDDYILSNTTQLSASISLLEAAKNSRPVRFESFVFDRDRLRTTTYNSKGRFSRAILCLFASQKPKDWEHCDRDVIAQNIFFATDRVNLHHIFPTNSAFVLFAYQNNKVSSNSLMNIAYLTQITNLNITNKNPFEYIKDYDKPAFEAIMPAHLLPYELLEWSRTDNMPPNALDLFVEKRIDLVLEVLREKLPAGCFSVVDTAQKQELNTVNG